MNVLNDFFVIRQELQQGKVIVYPTEAVYGLGCDAFNRTAVERILRLKGRSIQKGVILLIANWDQLNELTLPISKTLIEQVKLTWPGPVTWIFPKNPSIPEWLTGGRDSIAIRMSAHSIARELALQGPIVSTSANISSGPPARTVAEINSQFPTGIDILVEGNLGDESTPSAIYDVLSGKKLR
jgi:L-threonylcarbamoyladenylate synthase